MSSLALEYLFNDKPRTSDTFCADYDTLELESHGSKLYGLIAWPDGSFTSPRPCVIMFHGYPGSLRNDDIGYALCRAGCVVITPHHRGAWGSEGKYLPSHCVEDAVAIAQQARANALGIPHQIDPDQIFVLGHSMGGNTTLQTGKQLPWLKGLLLLAPYDPTRFVRDGHPEVLEDLLPQCRTLHCDGVDAIRDDIMGHLADFAFENTAAALKDQNIFCCGGSDDACAPPDGMVQPLQKELEKYPTDAIRRFIALPESHGLIGSRTELIKAVASFINDVLV